MVVPPLFCLASSASADVRRLGYPRSHGFQPCRCGRAVALAAHWADVRVEDNSLVTKSDLRKHLRKARRDHVAAQPPAIRSLLFNRPPEPLLAMIPHGAVIGLYHATANEAPTASYARFFLERGHPIALPRFAYSQAEMSFAAFSDPFTESDLVAGPFALMQPRDDAREVVPDVVFVPLVGFTELGDRLGQGGGHYDRWFDRHPRRTKIGLAWDVQRVDLLPVEAHDHRLDAVVTPTRIYGPFA